MHVKFMNLRKLLILPLLLLALAACGKKGPVRPLLQALPAEPQNLTVQQQGGRFLIAFGLPTKNQDGTPLTDLQGFQVYKMKYDPARDCPECRDTSVLLQSIDLDYLRAVRRVGDRLELWDTDLAPGFGYQYRVVAVNVQGAAGLPAVVRRPFFAPLPAPGVPTATAHDQMVHLEWPPLLPPTTGKLLGINIYRRHPGEIFPASPVNREPLAGKSYEDFGLHNDQTYDYALRSVVEISGVRVESLLTVPVPAIPQAGR